MRKLWNKLRHLLRGRQSRSEMTRAMLFLEKTVLKHENTIAAFESAMAHQKTAAREKLEARDKTIAELKREIRRLRSGTDN